MRTRADDDVIRRESGPGLRANRAAGRRLDPWLWATALGTFSSAIALDLSAKPFLGWGLRTWADQGPEAHAGWRHYLTLHLSILGVGALLSLFGALRVSCRRHPRPFSPLQTLPCAFLVLVAVMTEIRWTALILARVELREETLPRATTIREDQGD